MSRTFAVSIPHIKPQNLIPATQFTRKTNHPLIFSLCSFTQISSPIFTNPKFNKIYKSNNIVNRFVRSFSSRSICHTTHFIGFPLQRSLWFSAMSQNNDHGLTEIPQDSTKTVRCMIKGRVQGVFYRNWTIENASQLGLKGWVRNRRDGSVEALFSGKTGAVDEMMQRCRRGPPDAMVTAFQANPCNEDPGSGFERKPTA